MAFRDAAGDLRRAGAELAARRAPLADDDLAAKVSTYVEHRGYSTVDGQTTLAELLQLR